MTVINETGFDGKTLMYRMPCLMIVALGARVSGGSTDATTKMTQKDPPPAATVLN